MHYLARNAHKRVDPQLVLPGARSVVTLAVSYHQGAEPGRADASPVRQAIGGVVAAENGRVPTSSFFPARNSCADIARFPSS